MKDRTAVIKATGETITAKGVNWIDIDGTLSVESVVISKNGVDEILQTKDLNLMFTYENQLK